LVAAEPIPALHVVLVQPEIPPNTGSIARLCAATAVRLHLIKPLGFSLEDRYLRRAGLDYWPHVDLRVHEDWLSFRLATEAQAFVGFSARVAQSYLEAPLTQSPLYLVFGGETRGLPDDVRAAAGMALFRIPLLTPHVRSLNLSNAVSIAVYEALRQRGALDD
jgi:tRNA (cytidine/uridine-2'-O-)-methyltransferase